MNPTIDLHKPEEIARLRDFLLTAWNSVIGQAGEIRRQAKDQGNRTAMEWMEEVIAKGRLIAAHLLQADSA